MNNIRIKRTHTSTTTTTNRSNKTVRPTIITTTTLGRKIPKK